MRERQCAGPQIPMVDAPSGGAGVALAMTSPRLPGRARRLLVISCVALLLTSFVGIRLVMGFGSDGAETSPRRPVPVSLIERALGLFDHAPMEHFRLASSGSIAANSRSNALVKVEFLNERGYQRFGSHQQFDIYESSGGRFPPKSWSYDRGSIVRVGKRSAATLPDGKSNCHRAIFPLMRYGIPFLDALLAPFFINPRLYPHLANLGATTFKGQRNWHVQAAGVIRIPELQNVRGLARADYYIVKRTGELARFSVVFLPRGPVGHLRGRFTTWINVWGYRQAQKVQLPESCIGASGSS